MAGGPGIAHMLATIIDLMQCQAPQKVWLNVIEAANYSGLKEGTVRKLLAAKRLFAGGLEGRGGRQLILRTHLDAQIARGFPVLDYLTPAEAADLALAAPAVGDLIPQPRRRSTRPKITKLV